MATRPPISHCEAWPVARLGEITTKIGSGATPTGGEATYLATRQRFALVRSQNVFDRRFDEAGLAFISDHQAERLAGAALRTGDLLLNITGDGVTFARACMAPDSVLPACVNQHVAIVRVDQTKADPGYILAFLTHPQVKPYIEAFNSGGSRRAITRGHIESFLVPLAPLQEQKAIASILGALDDKIELNRRMNETLEAMARAIFQDWFVAFGPTRAKMDGRPPYLAPDLWAQFPDRLDDEGKPEGWATCPFAEAVEVIGGGTPRTSEPMFWNGSIPWFSVVDAPPDGQVWVIETEKTITEAGLDACSARLLPQGVTILSARGTVGRTALVGRPMAMNQSCYALKGRHERFGFFTYFVTKQLVGELRTRAHGSVFDTITRDTLAGVSVVMPTHEVIAIFENVVEPLLDRVRSNIEEGQTLASTRDLLLPKLMSGEVRVKDAERVSQGAA
jgi:type I restriction enzyme S subunit